MTAGSALGVVAFALLCGVNAVKLETEKNDKAAEPVVKDVANQDMAKMNNVEMASEFINRMKRANGGRAKWKAQRPTEIIGGINSLQAVLHDVKMRNEDRVDKILPTMAHYASLDFPSLQLKMNAQLSSVKEQAQPIHDMMQRVEQHSGKFKHKIEEAKHYVQDIRDGNAKSLHSWMGTYIGDLNYLAMEGHTNLARMSDWAYPMKKIIKEGAEEGVSTLKSLDSRSKRTKEYVTEQMKRLEEDHEKNMAKIKKKSKDFMHTYNHIRDIMESIPDDMIRKTENLVVFNEEEAEAREESMEETAELAEENVDKHKEILEEDIEHTQENLEKLSEISVEFKETGLENIDRDLEDFINDEIDELSETQGHVNNEETRLITKEKSSEQKIMNVAELLRSVAMTEKAFPREAERVIAEVTAYMSKKFMDLREERQKLIKYGLNDVEMSLHNTEISALEKMNSKRRDEKSAGDGSVKGVEQKAQRTVRNPMDKMIKMNDKIEELEDEGFDVNQGSKDLLKETAPLSKKLEKEVDEITKRIHEEDEDIKNVAGTIAESANEKLGTGEKLVNNQYDKSRKRFDSTDKQLYKDFVKSLNAQDRTVFSTIRKTDKSINKLETMGEKGEKRLKQRMDHVNGKISEVELSRLPELHDAVKEFMAEAVDQVNQAPGEIANAFNVAGAAVDVHLDGLDHISGLAQNSITAVTTPLNHRIKEHATNGIVSLKSQLSGVNGELNKNTYEVDTLYKQTEKQNADNSRELSTSTASVEEQFSQAQQMMHALENNVENAQHEHQQKVIAAGAEMENEIKDGVKTMLDNVKKDSDIATEKLNEEMKKTTRNIKESVGHMEDTVDEKTNAVEAERQSIAKRNEDMKGILDEAEAKVGKTQTTIGSLSNQVSAQITATSKGFREGRANLRAAAEGAEKIAEGKASAAFSAVEKDAAAAFQAQEKKTGEEAKRSQALVEKSGTNLGKAIANMRQQAEAEVDGAESETDKLREQINQERKIEEGSDKDLEKRFKEIENMGKAQAEAFSAGMNKAKLLLGSMAGKDHHEMRYLVDDLDELNEKAKDTHDKQIVHDQNDLDTVILQAKQAAQGMKSESEATSTKTKNYAEQMGLADEQAEKLVDEAQRRADIYEKKFGEKARLMSKNLDEAEIARKQDESSMIYKAEHSGKQLSHTIDKVGQMTTKVTAGVQYKLGSLNLEGKKIDRQLAHALEVSELTDEGAIQKAVIEAMTAATREDKLADWQYESNRDATRFRTKIQNQFASVGHELDLTALEEAEQKAMEEWAIQTQMAQLRDHLGDEMKGMSTASQMRLAQLAQRSGAEMAGLMANKSLTDEERAKKLAEIKMRAKLDAQTILEQDGELQLEQKTAARHMKVVTHNMEAGEEKLAGLEGAALPEPGVNAVVGRVQYLINEANNRIAAENTEHYGVPDADNEAPAELESAGESSPAALFEAAALQSEKSIEEDEALQKSLHTLRRRIETQ